MALGQKGACFVLKRERGGQSIQIRTNEGSGLCNVGAMVRSEMRVFIQHLLCTWGCKHWGTDVAHGSVKDWVRWCAYKDCAQSRCSVGVTFSLFQFVS